MNTSNVSPPKVLIISFIILLLTGSLLLYLPIAVKNGSSDFMTALFTATSALCVTGLVTVNTMTHWSIFGQVVILLLIQVGGLGVMTFATFFVILLGHHINLKQKLVLQYALSKSSMEDIIGIFRYLLRFSVFIELAGALILFIHWIPEMGWGKSLWYGIFHSVSAFNNAGIDLFANSLQGYTGDWVVNITISLLFIVGSLGFLVIYEVINYRATHQLSLHARMVLIGTGLVVALGAIVFLLVEYNHALIQLPWTEKLLASYFMAATRTCGFATIDMSTTMLPTQIMMMGLMFIGGAPGSTSGGIKVTTFLLLLLTVLSVFKGRKEVEFAGRRVSSADVFRAITVALVSAMVVFMVTILIALQNHDFVRVLFEAVSATGTVGLSLGITPELNGISQIMLVAAMIFGRLGPVTIGLAMAYQSQQPNIRFPEERIIIG
ncbi:MAG: TrkH family potassium uptake protein [Syntrophomonadaceae bacterium]|jgi:trk system potassium uptake protein TrkH